MSQLTSDALQLGLAVTEDDLHATLVQLTQLKVPQLKELCKLTGLAQKGKKQDLIDRLAQFVNACAASREKSLLLAVRTVVLKALNNDPIPNFSSLSTVLRTGIVDYQLITNQIATLERNRPMGHSNKRAHPSYGSHQPTSSNKMSSPSQTSSYYPKYQGPMLLFRSTIFYTLRRMVHGFPYVMSASMGRNVCNVPVNLNGEEIEALKQSRTARIYLFCALSSTPDPNSADIQFPPIEIYVDGVNTKQYVKGLKGKVGTCRPADLTGTIKDINRQFTINIVYSDAAEPYIVYLYIVDARSPQQIIDNVVNGDNFIPSNVTKREIQREYELNQDDDIVMATSSISLRCPLTYARMTYPVKSTQCAHIQCFDGLSFLTMQERIPSWICPVCSSKIDQLLLALSQYMKEILNSTSEDVDTVILNPDGSWQVAEGTGDSNNTDEKPSVPDPVFTSSSAEKSHAADDMVEIISLDSDSEDDQPNVTINATPPEAQNGNTSILHRNDDHSSNPTSNASNSTNNCAGSSTETSISKQVNIQEPLPYYSEVNTATTEPIDNVSSDDEPIQNYSRRKSNMITEVSVPSSTTSSPQPHTTIAVTDDLGLRESPVDRTPISVDSNVIPSKRNFPTMDMETTNNEANKSHELMGYGKAMNTRPANSSLVSVIESGNTRHNMTYNELNDDNSARQIRPETTLGNQIHTVLALSSPPSLHLVLAGEPPLPNGNDNHNVSKNNQTPHASIQGPLINNARPLADPPIPTLTVPTNGTGPLKHKHSAEVPTSEKAPYVRNSLAPAFQRTIASNMSEVPPPLNSHSSAPSLNTPTSLEWMNFANPLPGATGSQEGSIIATIQQMFSRSSSPTLTSPIVGTHSLENSKRLAVDGVPPCNTEKLGLSLEYPAQTFRSSASRGIVSASQSLVQQPYPGIPTNLNGQAVSTTNRTPEQELNKNSPGFQSLQTGRADTYRSMVQNSSQLINSYRQMERSNISNWNTDAIVNTRSVPEITQFVTAQQERAHLQYPSPSSITSHNASFSHNLPQSHVRTHPSTSTNGTRYSRSAFDTLREEQEKQKVKGLLGIEIATDFLLSGSPTPERIIEKENGNGTGHISNQLSLESRLLYNLPGLDRSSTSSTAEAISTNYTPTSPSARKRSISGSTHPQKTWNKRLNKQKFDPSEINEAHVIELDD